MELENITALVDKKIEGTPLDEKEVKQRSKSGRYVPSGIAYIHATFNNTKVSPQTRTNYKNQSY